MIAIGFRDKSQCLHRNEFIFLMSKFHESKVTFLESSAPSGRDTGSHHGMLHHSVITENHSQSAYRKQSDRPVPSPIHTSTVQHLHSRLRSQREGGGVQKDCENQRTQKSPVRLSSGNVRKATPMKVQQHGCPNQT